MAETILFKIATPATGEIAPYQVTWSQSADGVSWDDPIDTALVADLPYDSGTQQYRWASSLADPAKFHLLKSVTEGGDVSLSGVIVPPRPTRGDVCLIIADLQTLGLEPLEGIEFTVEIKRTPQVVNSVILQSSKVTQPTGVDGRVSFEVAKGGVYQVTSSCLGVPVDVDTAGQTMVNLATKLV